MRVLQMSALVACAVGACGETVRTSPVIRNPSVPPPVVPTSAAQLAFATSDDADFVKLGTPRPGEWLAEHPESGQTFDDYVDEDPVRAEEGRATLAFVHVGPFAPTERDVAAAAIELAGIWFDLPSRVLPDEELPREDQSRERTFPWHEGPVTQYHTRWFLNVLLPDRLPPDAVCLTAVTMADLYPEPSWNYVFGQASLRRRVGVYSLVRYFPAFWTEDETADSLTQARRRALQVMSHELGHMFGLEHCVFYECGMNGSNSLAESDRRPIHLCPVCLRKLQWNRGFDVLDRYHALAAYYERQGLTDEAAWVRKRAARIAAR